MNEALVQALIRLVTIGALAFVSAVGANLTILEGAVEDPIYYSLILSIATAVLSAIAKWLGGPTEQAREARGRTAAAAERPNWLSI